MNKKFELNPRLFEKEHFVRCRLKDCQAACCLFGVWVDEEKVTQILGYKEQIKSEMSAEYQNANQWFESKPESDPFTPSGKVIHTKVVEKESHKGDIFGYVISGELTLEVLDKGVFKVKAGDAFYVKAGRLHVAKNESDKVLKIVAAQLK